MNNIFSLYRTFANTVVRAYSAAIAASEILETGKEIINPSKPVGEKIVSIVRSGCCITAVVTSYLSVLSTNSGVSTIFLYFCWLATMGYSALKGKNKDTILINSLITKPKRPPNL